MHVIGINFSCAYRIHLESLWNRLNHGPAFSPSCEALNEILRKQTTNTRNQKSDSKRFQNTNRERIFLPRDKLLAHNLSFCLGSHPHSHLHSHSHLHPHSHSHPYSWGPGWRCAFAVWNLKRANLLYVFIAFNLDTIKATKKRKNFKFETNSAANLHWEKDGKLSDSIVDSHKLQTIYYI